MDGKFQCLAKYSENGCQIKAKAYSMANNNRKERKLQLFKPKEMCCVSHKPNTVKFMKKKIRAKTEKTKQNMGNSMKTTENQTDSKKTNIPTGKTETSEEKKTENNLRIRKGNNGKK